MAVIISSDTPRPGDWFPIKGDVRDYKSDKIEIDPLGKSPKEKGAKVDAGKPAVFRGLLDYFPRACLAVAQVSTRGAEKYSWKGWEGVPDGINRYSDALARHLLYKGIEGSIDKDTGLLHDAQIAWNALAVLEMHLRELEDKNDK